MSEHQCIQEERLRKLENNQVAGQTEAKVYFEFISRDIAEIKEQLKSRKPEDNRLWSKVVIETLKLLGQALTIIAAIFAAMKLAG
jgi:adenylate cyclase class IV